MISHPKSDSYFQICKYRVIDSVMRNSPGRHTQLRRRRCATTAEMIRLCYPVTHPPNSILNNSLRLRDDSQSRSFYTLLEFTLTYCDEIVKDKGTVEPSPCPQEWKNGEMKRFHGMVRARGWGLRSVSTQVKLTVIAVNLKRIAALVTNQGCPMPLFLKMISKITADLYSDSKLSPYFSTCRT